MHLSGCLTFFWWGSEVIRYSYYLNKFPDYGKFRYNSFFVFDPIIAYFFYVNLDEANKNGNFKKMGRASLFYYCFLLFLLCFFFADLIQSFQKRKKYFDHTIHAQEKKLKNEINRLRMINEFEQNR